MVTVEVRQVILSPIKAVWELILKQEDYPLLMDSVRSLTVVSAEELPDGIEQAVVEWEVELKGSVLRWREAERRSSIDYRIDYQQIDGDLAKFEGYWQLVELEPNKTEVTLQVDFEIGIPMLADMLEPVAERSVRENSISMLMSLAPVALGDPS